MRVFLDVDGILADWTGDVHRALGIPYNRQTWPYTKGPGGWNWHEEIGVSFKQCSELCDFNFWANLSKTYDGDQILDAVCMLGDITLLTTPMPNVISASGKVEWIRRNYPEYEKHMMVTTENKVVIAGVPNSILVDDNGDTVKAWNAAGGKAVLVPRWWNHAHPYALDAVPHVLHQLEEICQES